MTLLKYIEYLFETAREEEKYTNSERDYVLIISHGHCNEMLKEIETVKVPCINLGDEKQIKALEQLFNGRINGILWNKLYVIVRKQLRIPAIVAVQHCTGLKEMINHGRHNNNNTCHAQAK